MENELQVAIDKISGMLEIIPELGTMVGLQTALRALKTMKWIEESQNDHTNKFILQHFKEK